MIMRSEEFKQEAVRIALSSGLPRERVAADLGIGKSTLGKWLILFGKGMSLGRWSLLRHFNLATVE